MKLPKLIISKLCAVYFFVNSITIFLYSQTNHATQFDGDQQEIVKYFKEIAIGSEYGDQVNVITKWASKMKIYVGGSPAPENILELTKITNEINILVSDGFQIDIVSDSAESNFYIFFGSKYDIAKKFPDSAKHLDYTDALFTVYALPEIHEVFAGYMYVDIFRTSITEQHHLLREELTQSLGLMNDSPTYYNSIFQSSWTKTTEYSDIDKELIRILYNKKIRAGHTIDEVEYILMSILSTKQWEPNE